MAYIESSAQGTPGATGPAGPTGPTGAAGANANIAVTTITNQTHGFSDFSTAWDPGLSVTFVCANSNETVIIWYRLWWLYNSGTTPTGMSRLLQLDGVDQEGWNGGSAIGGLNGQLQYTSNISGGGGTNDQLNDEMIVLTGLASGSHTVKLKFFAVSNNNGNFTIQKAQIAVLYT